MDHRSSHLFDRGFRDLESRFDPGVDLVRSPFQADMHQPHPSIWYAHCLLARYGEGDAALAEKIISRTLELQERRAGNPHYGNFRWVLEDEAVIDLNACQFVLEALVHLFLQRAEGLPAALIERIKESMRLSLAEAERLDVHWTYTNIYLLDAHNSILGGQLLMEPAIRARGEARLAEWAERTRHVGAPHEFNSPTYAAVQINALATIATYAEDAATRRLALEMEQLVWRHVARFWHAPTMQLGGPHSRAYRRDVAGASGFLKVVLYKLLGDPRLLAETPYYAGPDSEGEVMVSLTDYHCPQDAEQMFREPATRDVCEVTGPDMRLTARITPEFALGTMSHPYGVGDPLEPWPAHDSCILYYARPAPPGYGVVYCRYRINSGQVGWPSREGVPPWLDIWDDGVFRTAQNCGRAVVAYGLSPRGQRPISGLRLDVRALGDWEDDEVWIGDRLYAGGMSEPAVGEPILIAAGEAYIGIVALAPTRLGHGPPVIVWQDGQELVISVLNYEGPPKVFWEYRSLGGPFFKGNVHNGFALWVSPRRDFASIADFREAVASLPLRDSTSGTTRRVEWGAGDEMVALEYDLAELR